MRCPRRGGSGRLHGPAGGGGSGGRAALVRHPVRTRAVAARQGRRARGAAGRRGRHDRRGARRRPGGGARRGCCAPGPQAVEHPAVAQGAADHRLRHRLGDRGEHAHPCGYGGGLARLPRARAGAGGGRDAGHRCLRLRRDAGVRGDRGLALRTGQFRGDALSGGARGARSGRGPRRVGPAGLRVPGQGSAGPAEHGAVVRTARRDRDPRGARHRRAAPGGHPQNGRTAARTAGGAAGGGVRTAADRAGGRARHGPDAVAGFRGGARPGVRTGARRSGVPSPPRRPSTHRTPPSRRIPRTPHIHRTPLISSTSRTPRTRPTLPGGRRRAAVRRARPGPPGG